MPPQNPRNPDAPPPPGNPPPPGGPAAPRPGEASPAAETTNERTLFAQLHYGLSLPERTVRSVSALAGGLLNESAARLLPAAFRSSKSYSVFLQQALDMAVHDFGGVATAETEAATVAAEEEAFLARKAVGGLLDIAGVATLHLSPMTVLAVFSDMAYGSGHYLQQLSAELKKQGVIDQQSAVDNVADLLTALRTASDQATDTLDRPPINLEGFRETVNQTRRSLEEIDPSRLIPQAEITRLWSEMESTAREADVGILDVSATMTLFTLNRMSLATRGALSSITVAGNLLEQHILAHYVDALQEIHTAGFYRTLQTASAPYLTAVWSNFSDDRETWTEDFLSGRLWDRTLQTLRGWWRRPREETSSAERDAPAS